MNTTVSEMKRLKKGDKFTVYNEEHIAYSDAHQSDDSSYEEFLVYDEVGNAWYEFDFVPDKEIELNDTQIEQIDAIHNTAYELLKLMARLNKSTAPIDYEWNMEQIGEVVDAASAVLQENGYDVYYPAYVEDDKKVYITDFDNE